MKILKHLHNVNEMLLVNVNVHVADNFCGRLLLRVCVWGGQRVTCTPDAHRQILFEGAGEDRQEPGIVLVLLF